MEKLHVSSNKLGRLRKMEHLRTYYPISCYLGVCVGDWRNEFVKGAVQHSRKKILVCQHWMLNWLIYSAFKKYSEPLYFVTFCHITTTSANWFVWNFNYCCKLIQLHSSALKYFPLLCGISQVWSHINFKNIATYSHLLGLEKYSKIRLLSLPLWCAGEWYVLNDAQYYMNK